MKFSEFSLQMEPSPVDGAPSFRKFGGASRVGGFLYPQVVFDLVFLYPQLADH